VSSLDYANAVSLAGFTIPATSVRRIKTDVELEDQQSFVIAGLIDNNFTEGLSKIPGLANIPLLGKLFTSRQQQKKNTELIVIVTPEIVRPIPKGMPLPDLNRPKPFLPPNTTTSIMQPGMDKTGPVPVNPAQPSLPFEQLVAPAPKKGQQAETPSMEPQVIQPPQAPPVQNQPPTGVIKQ
jgi:pilus assembly protein CpaC